MSIVVQDIFIPESGAECAEWVSYFNKLSSHFGKDNAKIIWLKTWSVNGSTSCTAKPDFLEFLKKHDIDVSNAATSALAGISEIGGNVMGLGKNLTKALSVGIPAVLIGVVVLILYFLFRTVRNTNARDLIQFTPAGQATTMAQAATSGALNLTHQ